MKKNIDNANKKDKHIMSKIVDYTIIKEIKKNKKMN